MNRRTATADATGLVRLPGVIACEQCDLLYRPTALTSGQDARCRRCDALLASGRPHRHDLCLALTLAGLVTFVIAQLNPIVGLEVQDQVQSATLWEAVSRLYSDGAWVMSALVLLTTMICPAVELGAICYLLLALRDGDVTPGFATVLRITQAVRPWVMVEVFMLGVLVAVVKLSAMAEIVTGVGVWSFAALMLLLTLASATLEDEPLWAALEASDPQS